MLMQGNENYDVYNKLVRDLKHVVFYVPGLGVLRSGELVRDVVPAASIIDFEGNSVRAQFLSRIFVHHSRDENDVKKVSNFINALGFVPVVYADYELSVHNNLCVYDKNKIYGNNSVLIISSSDIRQPCDIRSIILESQKSFRSSFDNGCEDKIRVVTYDPNNKPLKQKIYDAVLYAERWSLLTTQEKVMRCIFSIFSLSIPFIPPLMLLSYLGNLDIRERAYSMNLLPWQYRIYANVSQSVYDVMINDTDETRQKMMQSNIMKEAQRRGFILECEEGGEELTDLGKKVSEKHNLLLIANNKELSKKQLLLRITTFSVLAFVCFTKTVALICYLASASRIALYFSMLSYFVIFVQGLYLISLKTTTSKVCAAICMVFAGFMLMVSAFLLYQGNVEFQYQPIISGVMIVITGVMLGIALVCNRYYKQDRDLVSKLGGISTTAYLSMKKQICEIDQIKSVELEGGYNYQIIDGFKLALFNAYKAGLFGKLQQNEHQDSCERNEELSGNISNILHTSIVSSQNDQSNSQNLTH
ncbi:hypothetical protein [Ehrlichia muris]|uniref:Putative membrane protein n=2 Tax=Ehrlichia TaxID=943 RepID=A0A0F3N5T6_9RICK|nr:hypothetical protein [Ehrlichia muris]KJV63458.1 putative membrane protein [Ehrlichia cf. muris str. EmCRT]